jgi:SAM-dependent methyltransferase
MSPRPNTTSRPLSPVQVETFSELSVTRENRAAYEAGIASRFVERPFRHLDVGGGAGGFAAWLRKRFPEAESTVLERNESLAGRARDAGVDRVVCGTLEEASACLPVNGYDLVTVNLVLHHLVVGGYAATRRLQRRALETLGGLVAPGGWLCILEDLPVPWGPALLPTRLVHGLTSLRRAGGIFQRLGAVSAGTGVCFLPRGEWLRLFAGAGLACEEERLSPPKRLPRWQTWPLGMRCMRRGLFWLRPDCRADG